MVGWNEMQSTFDRLKENSGGAGILYRDDDDVLCFVASKIY